MTGKNSAPYFPNFGAGAPGAGVPTNSPYYDTTTTPFTEYVYHAGSWHQAGVNSAGNNATSIQGVPVAVTAPSLNQILQYGGVNYAPAAPPAGGGGVVYNYNPPGGLMVTIPDDAGYVLFLIPGTFNDFNITLPANPIDGQNIFFGVNGSLFGNLNLLPNIGQVSSVPVTARHGDGQFATRKYTLGTTSWGYTPNSTA